MVSLIGPPVNEKIAVKPHRPGVGGEHDPEAITQGRAGGGGGDGQQSRSVFCLRWWFHERVRCSFKSGELDILPSKSAFYCMIIFRIKIYKRTEGLNGILDTAGKGFMKNVSGTQPREDMSL